MRPSRHCLPAERADSHARGQRLVRQFTFAEGCDEILPFRLTSAKMAAQGRAALALRSHESTVGKTGAGEGARTLDPDLGKVVLYH
jgi:hypothetical protein